MRIVKKTLKGDLMGRTGFKAVKPTKPGKARPDEAGARDQAAGAVAFQPMQDGAALPLARAVLAEGLYKDIGAKGSKMQHPAGTTFHLNPRFGEGVAHTQHNVTVPLQAGHVAGHRADLVIEL